MNTIAFIAAHNDKAASIEVLMSAARLNYRQSLRSLAYAVQARGEGDIKTARDFERESERYAVKSDESFAVVFAAAQGAQK